MKNVYIFIMDVTRIGGTERAVANLYEILKVRGDNVRVVSLCGRKVIPFSTFSINDIIWVDLPYLGKGFTNKVHWMFSFYKKLCFLRIPDKSVLLGTGHNINSVLALFKLTHKKKAIACEHIQLNTIPFSSIAIMRALYRFLDGIVVLSDKVRRNYIKKIHKLPVIHIIPNALPFQPNIQRLKMNRQIIMVGRLSAEKGYERLVPIATYLKENYPTWNIKIYGNGELADVLKKQFRENALSNISLEGATTDIQSKYMESSVLLMTSYTEVMPMVILEANACGIPVIAYECEGTKDLIIDGINGFLIKNGCVLDFCDKIGMLMTNEILRNQMSQSAYEYSQKYSPKKVAQLWYQLLDSMYE